VKIGKAEEVGNAYIYENMSDEEKRIAEDEKQKILQAEKSLKNMKGKELETEKKRIELEKVKQEEERKNKVAEITKVDFLDRDGKEKTVFETGDDMSIRIYFKINQMKDEFNFGLAIYNQEGNYISGINTIFDKIDTKKYLQDGYFQVDYKNIPLIGNSYYIATSIVKDNFSSFYALLPKSQCFKIITTRNKNQGIVDMDYTWK
jgi:hypothetical protein